VSTVSAALLRYRGRRPARLTSASGGGAGGTGTRRHGGRHQRGPARGLPHRAADAPRYANRLRRRPRRATCRFADARTMPLSDRVSHPQRAAHRPALRDAYRVLRRLLFSASNLDRGRARARGALYDLYSLSHPGARARVTGDAEPTLSGRIDPASHAGRLLRRCRAAGFCPASRTGDERLHRWRCIRLALVLGSHGQASPPRPPGPRRPSCSRAEGVFAQFYPGPLPCPAHAGCGWRGFFERAPQRGRDRPAAAPYQVAQPM